MPLPNETLTRVAVGDFILDPNDINGSHPNLHIIETEANLHALRDAVVKTEKTGLEVKATPTFQLVRQPFTDDSLDIFFNGVLTKETREYTVDRGFSPWYITWIQDPARIDDDDEITLRIVGY